MMWWHGGRGWGGWIAMALAMAAFWSLVMFAVVWDFRTGDHGVQHDERAPQRIIDKRSSCEAIGPHHVAGWSGRDCP